MIKTELAAEVNCRFEQTVHLNADTKQLPAVRYALDIFNDNQLSLLKIYSNTLAFSWDSWIRHILQMDCEINSSCEEAGNRRCENPSDDYIYKSTSTYGANPFDDTHT